ncbi:hypothetical protein EW026_g122 [Hermanssonia centrifuga]|uniref:XLF-like N-terminal domain-containing protein n=1 Tax=Hermanssonia centrifuga TaxID=98765 RepID=A0A4S4KVD9_9APHY|nr:hypothetical protein EW026_g122 [Hermanssonia centrifuga]
MEYLSEEHMKLMLNKEWFVKIDNNKSIPYLMKFYTSTVDQCCSIMITDTKEVWGEVLSSNKVARRWRDCNPLHAAPFDLSEEEEDDWRSQTLDLLTALHSLGGITDTSFDIVESRNAVSSDVLSKHLIMPLISATHLAFSSADPVSELSEADLEKAVDKVGRTARRTVDTHVKHAISRPRVATTLRRMTAMFNFLSDMPSVISDVHRPEFKMPALTARSRATSKAPHEPVRLSPAPSSRPYMRALSEDPLQSGGETSAANVPQKQVAVDDSETERSSDEELELLDTKGKGKDKGPSSLDPIDTVNGVASHQSSLGLGREPPSPPHKRLESPSPPPSKKIKTISKPSSSSSDEDSEAERKRRVQRLKTVLKITRH